jgi:hypothetical protein
MVELFGEDGLLGLNLAFAVARCPDLRSRFCQINRHFFRSAAASSHRADWPRRRQDYVATHNGRFVLIQSVPNSF